jgi:hypothetical protein
MFTSYGTTTLIFAVTLLLLVHKFVHTVLQKIDATVENFNFSKQVVVHELIVHSFS